MIIAMEVPARISSVRQGCSSSVPKEVLRCPRKPHVVTTAGLFDKADRQPPIRGIHLDEFNQMAASTLAGRQGRQWTKRPSAASTGKHCNCSPRLLRKNQLGSSARQYRRVISICRSASRADLSVICDSWTIPLASLTGATYRSMIATNNRLCRGVHVVMAWPF